MVSLTLTPTLTLLMQHTLAGRQHDAAERAREHAGKDDHESSRHGVRDSWACRKLTCLIAGRCKVADDVRRRRCRGHRLPKLRESA